MQTFEQMKERYGDDCVFADDKFIGANIDGGFVPARYLVNATYIEVKPMDGETYAEAEARAKAEAIENMKAKCAILREALEDPDNSDSVQEAMGR